MKDLADAPDVAPAKGFGASSFPNVAACVAGFVFTCLVLHAFLPAPNIGDISAKLHFFATHKDEFDTIFVGSSRIHNGVAPSIFDQVLAENGIPSRSFNFGAAGMYPPEEFYVLEQILALHPRHLKRLFLEIDDIQAAWLPGDQTSQRAVTWHDTKSTWLIVRKILDMDAGTARPEVEDAPKSAPPADPSPDALDQEHQQSGSWLRPRGIRCRG